MCQFKSGIILKNRVVLASEGNESHSNLLENLSIEDTHINATKAFVRAELVPKDNDKTTDVTGWKYRVDQDIVPDWYEKDPERYEKEFRDAVTEYMADYRKRFEYICGYYWTSIKDDNIIYYFMNGVIERSKFGETNNYTKSSIRNNLINSKLATDLKKEFGNKLIPISLDLTSMDGFKDYGILYGDILAIPNIQLIMKYGEKIPLIDVPYWLSTPNQTPTRKDSSYVQYVSSSGNVFYFDCVWGGRGVRPFFILQS